MEMLVIVPPLGETVEKVRIVRWFKQVGDPVQAEEALLEVATEKTDVQIESPISGVVVEIRSAIGEWVPVGAEVARIAGA